MRDIASPPGWTAEQTLLKRLDDLGVEIVELRGLLPAINDEDWRPKVDDLLTVAATIVSVQGAEPNSDLGEALTGLRDATRALKVPRADDVLDMPTATLRTLREIQGRLRTAVDDAWDALAPMGVEAQDFAELTVLTRGQRVTALLRRLDALDKSLIELAAAKDGASGFVQQARLVGGYTGTMRGEVGLARQHLTLGQGSFDLGPVSRAVAAMGDSTARYIATVRNLARRLSDRVVLLSEETERRVVRVRRGTRTIHRLVLRSNSDRPNSGPPALPTPGTISRDGPDYPEMVLIPSGSFMMGVPEAESKREGTDDRRARPVHQVTIAQPFWIGRYAVTRGQFAVFARETGFAPTDWRRTRFTQDDNHPVVSVSVADAEAYLGWLRQKTGHRYRLPSESEWEYAARAGTATARYWGDRWDPERANAAGIHEGTTPVGTFGSNPFGLYDMLGNVWEWCADGWRGSYNGAPADGSAWIGRRAEGGASRVIRGGSWDDGARLVRSA
jgi:formylglycine-generating enzyme required for sulfatase activity